MRVLPRRQRQERPRRAILATLPVFASLVAVVTLTLLGWLAPVEAGLQAGLSELWPEPPLASDVVMIEIDDASIRRLGAPPWSVADWQEVAEALDSAGFDEVWLAEHPARALDAGPAELPEPLRLASALPDLVRTNPPLHAKEAGELPRLGLSRLLRGELRAAPAPDAHVMLGFAEAPWASRVPVGAQAVLLPRLHAEALSVATLRSRAARPALPLPVVLPLAALLVLLGALVAHLEPRLPAEAWILLLPLGVGLLAVLLAVSGLCMLPVAPLALALLLGALAETLRLRARMAGFFRRLGHRLSAAELGVPHEPDASPRGMLQQLASLTWNHLPTERMLYVHNAGSRVEVAGGFGLAEGDLDGALTPDRLTTLARRGRCDEVALDARTALAIVEVPRHGRVLGWWFVAWDVGERAPDTRRLEDLARWVSEQVPPPPVLDPMARLLRTDRQLDALEATFDRADRAARKQRRLLATAAAPLAIADRAGTIVFQNAAFATLFESGAPRSVRELVYRADGSPGLSARMRRLFESGEALEVRWPERDLVIHASPAAEGARAGVLLWVRRPDAVARISAAK